MRWLDGITDSMDMGLGGLQELVIGRPSILWFMGLQKVRHNWATELRLTILCAKSLQSPISDVQWLFSIFTDFIQPSPWSIVKFSCSQKETSTF